MDPITALTDGIRSFITSLNVEPDYYRYLFPRRKYTDDIRKLMAEGSFPTAPDLAPAITYAILLSVFRLALQVFVLKPLARFTLRIPTIPEVFNKEIDAAFPRNVKRKVEDREIEKLANNSGGKLTIDDINKYLWARKREAMASKKIVKFVEACWRFIMYASFCVLGYYALFVPKTAEWVTVTDLLWANWPYHGLPKLINIYYQVEFGAYLHQLAWTEVSRSDAAEMIVHHLVTLGLLLSSYLSNFTRIGVSVLLLHDAADILLESAKVFNYASKVKGQEWAKHFCDVLFAGFAITFFVTRLVIFPRNILYSLFFEAPVHFGVAWWGYWIFFILLVVLQILHIFWFYLIAKMIYRLLSTGIEKDERSDDEEEVEEEYKGSTAAGAEKSPKK